MAIAEVSHVTFAPGANGGTSGSIDTSGATLLTICVAHYAAGGALTVSDSKGNTYTPLTAQANGFGRQVVYYCENAVVGTGHTFTVTGTTSLPGCVAQAWSGVKTSGAFDQENGATVTSTTGQPGSVTPSEDNELVLASQTMEFGANTESIDSPFTGVLQIPLAGGNNFGVSSAYDIQTTATARNPTWSSAQSIARELRISTFKAAAAGGGQGPIFDGRALGKGRILGGSAFSC